MKKLWIALLSIGLVSLAPFKGQASEMKLGFVNVKTCIEKSKHGQQERQAFEGMKKQMTESLEKSDKELTELAKKLKDQDYLDGLSPTAEQELKEKFQTLSGEFGRYQNQYYQLLQQANYRMLQSLHDSISKGSENVREKNHFTMILNQDSAFASAPSLDITDEVIKEMDRVFELNSSSTETAEADKKNMTVAK